ncbi:MAG: hypothetical protein JXQ73_30145 [Phycisphaerae bacterium]|nr:hypothetical protein [Phycisphaerae bacterium]
MGTNNNQPAVGVADPLIDEVRRIRREISQEFGNDVDRLCDHLEDVQREYESRRGVFSGISSEAAASLVESWGEEARTLDDPLVDEVRRVRERLGKDH